MILGVPTEVKTAEVRVAMTPDGVRELVAHGHTVLVQSGAGEGSSISDADFTTAGATLVPTAADAWGAELVVKVKEPQEDELPFLRDSLTLFTYLHLAAYPDVGKALLASGTTSLAYETVQLDNGALPLLAPMSEVAGRMATQVGANLLERPNGGRGVLLGGVPGVRPARVVVLGAGNVGWNAAWIAQGMEAEVWVLVAGGRAPMVVTEEMVRGMKRSAVIIDVAVDQGGCIETTHETTHIAPTYEVHGVLHYAVGNMPGAVPHTSTYALTNATLPYIVEVAHHGVRGAVTNDPALLGGLSTVAGQVTNEAVADALGIEFVEPMAVLA